MEIGSGSAQANVPAQIVPVAHQHMAATQAGISVHDSLPIYMIHSCRHIHHLLVSFLLIQYSKEQTGANTSSRSYLPHSVTMAWLLCYTGLAAIAV